MKKGMTLLELVVAMVILGLAVPVLLNLFAAVGQPYVQAETIARATQLASAVMEEILSKRFDEELEKVTGEWSGCIGPDTGETLTDPSNWDDVNDYNGYSYSFPPGSPFDGFSYSVSVSYVIPAPPVIAWLDRLEGWFVGSAYATPCCIGCSSDYQKIIVTVNGPAGVSITLSALATLANSQGVPAKT